MTLKQAIVASGKRKELEERVKRQNVWAHCKGKRGMNLKTAQIYSDILGIPLSELAAILRGSEHA